MDIIKTFNTEVITNDEEKTLKQYITTKDEDRDGDIVVPQGAKLDNYRSNPVVLWQHNRSLPPIAKSLYEVVDDKGVVSKAKFADTPLANDIYTLAKGGFINKVSIGFKGIKIREENTGEMIEMWGMQFPKVRTFYDEWELYEYSYVNIPANPSAEIMREMKSKEMVYSIMKAIEQNEAQKEIELIRAEFTKELTEIKNSITALTDTMIAEERIKELIALSTNVNDITELTNKLNTLDSNISGIVEEFKAIKDAKKKADLQAMVNEAVLGAIREAKGKVDKYFKN